jgi:hypothetical protein
MNIPKLFTNRIFPITPYDGIQETFTHTLRLKESEHLEPQTLEVLTSEEEDFV